MARRSDHTREELREMALTAAERMVKQEGAAQLSTRKVAAEIGYTVGTLYLVFSNLDDLIVQINARTLDKLDARLGAATSACRQPQRCIEAMAHAYFDFAVKHKNLWRLLFEYIHADTTEVPVEYKDKVQRMFDLVEQQLCILLAGRTRRQAATAARALWCGVHGVCSLAMSGKLEITGVKSVQGLMDMLVENFLRGLVAQSK